MWILFIIAISVTLSGNKVEVIHTQEFTTLERCKQAESNLDNTLKILGVRPAVTMCVAK